MRKRKWTNNQLENAAKESISFRQVLQKIGLKPTGGNYQQLKKYFQESKINSNHFKGQGWNLGNHGKVKPKFSLEAILVVNSNFQSYKLKKRLFQEGLKTEKCEKCGWAEKSTEGYIPLELDHINGCHNDNRLSNLRILCPNCHSLTYNYRGRKNKKSPNGGIGIRAALKML
jgi:hypothetical protein